jgi:hypothetical protein
MKPNKIADAHLGEHLLEVKTQTARCLSNNFA